MATTQLWELTREGRHHVLTATSSGWSRTLEWRIDDESVVTRQSSNDRLQLDHDDLALDVRFSALGAGRRATLHTARDGASAKARAEIGLGGLDLVPAPGSPAAKRAQWITDHPRLHTLRATVVGAAGVVVPLVIAFVVARAEIRRHRKQEEPHDDEPAEGRE